MVDETAIFPDLAAIYLEPLSAVLTTSIASLSLEFKLSSSPFNNLTLEALPDDKTVISNRVLICLFLVFFVQRTFATNEAISSFPLEVGEPAFEVDALELGFVDEAILELLWLLVLELLVLELLWLFVLELLWLFVLAILWLLFFFLFASSVINP